MPPPVPSYLIALRLEGRACAVVGGGPIALGKIEGLLASGAEVTVIAPEVLDELAELPVKVLRRRYEAGDLEGCWLVCAATGDPAVDARVHADAEARRILVNAADDVDACSFFLPAVLRLGRLGVAVSTDGESPALAAALRDRLAGELPATLATVVERLGAARRGLRSRGRRLEPARWRSLCARLLDEAIDGEAEDELCAEIARFERSGGRTGDPEPGE